MLRNLEILYIYMNAVYIEFLEYAYSYSLEYIIYSNIVFNEYIYIYIYTSCNMSGTHMLHTYDMYALRLFLSAHECM